MYIPYREIYLTLFMVACLDSLANGGPFSDIDVDGPYRVIRIIPRNVEQFDNIINIWQNASYFDLDFWQEPRRPNASVDIMVNPKAYPVFRHLLEKQHLEYNVTIQNVEKLVREKNKKSERLRKWGRRMHDEVGTSLLSSNFNLASYSKYGEILQYMIAVQHDYPSIAQVINIGKTHEDRPLYVIKIGKQNDHNTNKKSIWIDAGIHAREWIAPATALYFISQLVKNYDTDYNIKRYVDEIDWYIMPLVNPDGYEYTKTTSDPKVRFWRKNRSPPICRQTIWGQECCQGVDLNRNFDFHWGETGASKNPCEEIYAGQNAFSEPETKAVADFILPRRTSFIAFITLHSYSQIWMYPYGHQKKTYPRDVHELKSIAMRATRALQSLYDTKYEIGTGADTLYPASGGSDDWAKLAGNIKFVYLLELRPEDNVWDGFILGEDQIIPTARETWEGVKAVADAVLDYDPQNDASGTSTAAPEQKQRQRSSACMNTELQCQLWADLGGCQMWPDMAERCPVSCGTCNSTRGRRYQQGSP